MPLYEYACETCSHRFERIVKHGTRTPRCPECGAACKRLASAPAIQFKGTGWYLTDYSRKGKSGGGEEGKDTAAKGAADKSTAKTADKGADKSKAGATVSDSKSTGTKKDPAPAKKDS